MFLRCYCLLKEEKSHWKALNSGETQHDTIWISSPPKFSPYFPSQTQEYWKRTIFNNLFSQKSIASLIILGSRFYHCARSKPLRHLPTNVRHSPKRKKGIFLAPVTSQMRNINKKNIYKRIVGEEKECAPGVKWGDGNEFWAMQLA